jgi:hypothetical protein
MLIDSRVIDWIGFIVDHRDRTTDEAKVVRLVLVAILVSGIPVLLRPIIVVPCRLARRLILQQNEPSPASIINTEKDTPWTDAILASRHFPEEQCDE